jgi:hypothetical protein
MLLFSYLKLTALLTLASQGVQQKVYYEQPGRHFFAQQNRRNCHFEFLVLAYVKLSELSMGRA